MRKLLSILGMLIGGTALAAQPVQTIRLALNTNQIAQGTLIQLTSSVAAQVSTVHFYNGCAGTDVSLMVGAISAEGTVLVMPPGTSAIIPLNLSKASRLSAMANGGLCNSGTLIINLFGDYSF